MPDPALRVHPSPFDCDYPALRAAGDAATTRGGLGSNGSYGPAELDPVIVASNARTGFFSFFRLHPILGRFRPAEEVRTSSEGDLLRNLKASFPPEHIGAYLQAAQGDQAKALQLHTWNTALSSALYVPLQGLELALRHAMHRNLAARYGDNWYDNPAAGLDLLSRQKVSNAKKAAERAGAVTPSHVVEKLCFGFWTALLGAGGRIDWSSNRKADYARTLWAPALRGAFPHRKLLTRRQAQRALDRLRRLRNKVAHYEPIFMRPLHNDHQRILAVAGWISPDARAWIERSSRVPHLLATGNGAGDVDLLLPEVQAA